MATKVRSLKKWAKVGSIIIQLTKNEKGLTSYRIYCTIEFEGKTLEKDLFPYNDDFQIGGLGRLTISTTESFKMKTLIEII